MTKEVFKIAEESRKYKWAPFDVRKLYAEKLDSVLLHHDVRTTTAWIEFAEELADSLDSTFVKEAESLIAAFQEVSNHYSPQAVAAIYQTIHMPNNALLAHEILAAAEYAEEGMTSSELSDMAMHGEFEGGSKPDILSEANSLQGPTLE